MPPQLGKIVVVLGLLLVALGVFLWLGGGNWFSWFGRLPGDIRVERPGFRLYAPLMSMLLVSLLVSSVLWIVRWLGK